jgi:hypothetical protein
MKWNYDEMYKFLFWAMLILMVDNNSNKKTYLLQISRFCVKLGIGENGIKYIFKVAKLVYGGKKGAVAINNSINGDCFDNVIKMYKNVEEGE